MEIAILAVGRLKSGPESALCATYLDRAKKAGGKLGLRGFDVREIPESRAGRPDDRIAQEAEALVAKAGGVGSLIALDAGGDLLDSEQFAKILGDGALTRIAFIIGGADGLGASVLGRSDRRISFGRVTWPHQIVRVLLAEQLYRATAILSGHPYHRA